MGCNSSKGTETEPKSSNTPKTQEAAAGRYSTRNIHVVWGVNLLKLLTCYQNVRIFVTQLYCQAIVTNLMCRLETPHNAVTRGLVFPKLSDVNYIFVQYLDTLTIGTTLLCSHYENN